MGLPCKVCESPYRSAIDFDLLSGSVSAPTIASKYSLLKDNVRRHRVAGHVEQRANIVATYDTSKKTPENVALASAQKDMANTVASIAARAERIMTECESQYERFKSSDNAKDISEMLKLNLAALRELGALAGAYPKAQNGPTVDARQIHLSGLSADDLRALVAGLKGFSE